MSAGTDIAIMSQYGFCIAKTLDMNKHSRQDDMANAVLIAAAPSLVDALDNLIKALPRESIHSDELVKATHEAVAALLRARGE
jgi:hypothetical protein